MINGRLPHDQAGEGKENNPLQNQNHQPFEEKPISSGGRLFTVFKYFLATIKAITSGAQTFFSNQKVGNYFQRQDKPLSLFNIIWSFIGALTSLIFTAGSRSIEMSRYNKNEDELLSIDGSNLLLLEVADYKEISKDTLNNAKKKNTPLLIKKANNFIIYGHPKGSEKWKVTSINSNTEIINQFPFNHGIIKRKNVQFTAQVIGTLAVGHQRLAGYNSSEKAIYYTAIYKAR